MFRPDSCRSRPPPTRECFHCRRYPIPPRRYSSQPGEHVTEMVVDQRTVRCQCSSRMDPLVRCCWAAEMSVLDGRSVITCSRTQPPVRIRVLESEKLHFTLGTTPLSVLCWPKLSGFWRSICLLVPPARSVSDEPKTRRLDWASRYYLE